MTSSNRKNPALGRGLSALLSDTSASTGGTSMVAMDKIEPNPFNPRTDFEPSALQELADSIKELGIIQPITLRKINAEKYQIISGERRFKASQIAVVHPNQRRFEPEGTLQLLPVVNLDQHGHAQAMGQGLQFSHEHIVQASGNQQDAIRTHRPRFVDLVGVDHEILAQDWQVTTRPSLLEKVNAPLEE